ncbi:MAG: hypothetical protein GY719_08895 [bacterium]|nr:hypothetical protein [bacterium]
MRGEAKRDEPTSPFVGLRPFESHESFLFFGRDEQTVALLQQLHHHGFVAVVGSSGSGKSSLVRAGLIPKLRGGFLAGERERWHVAIMKPGQDPLGNLAAALESVTGEAPEDLADAGTRGVVDAIEPLLADGDANLLLLVDQFEELFRFGDPAAETEGHERAAEFVKILLDLTRRRELPLYLVLTMRSDFLGDCDLFAGLPEALNRSQYLVPRLTRQQLRDAIVGPIRLFGGAISDSLVSRVLNDAGRERDSLPVVQHVLMRTWRVRPKKGEIGHDHYKKAGTLERALSDHADEALDGTSGQQRALTERVFRALTDVDETNRRIRRPVRLSELEAVTRAGPGQVWKIVERFSGDDCSFLVPPQGADPLIDISHESLIRQWGTLRAWADAEAEAGAEYRRLVETARRHEEKTGELLVGRDLEKALEWRRENSGASREWAKRYGGGFQATQDFLNESRRRQEEKQAEEVRRRDLDELETALKEANYRLAEVFEEKAGAALKAAREGGRTEEYRKAWLYSLAALTQEVGDRQLPVSMARLLMPDLRAGAFPEIWRSRRPQLQDEHESGELAFSPDGTRLAVAGSHAIRLLNLETGEAVATLERGKSRTPTAFSPDGRYLTFATEEATIRLWNVEAGEAGRRLEGHTAEISSVAFSPGGIHLASGSRDHTIRLWNVEAGEAVANLKGHSGGVSSVAFSPDGTSLASGSIDHTIRLWDVASGKPTARLEGRPVPVSWVVFSADGTRLLSHQASHWRSETRSEVTELWSVETGEIVATLDGHRAEFSSDGRRLVSISSRGAIHLWAVETGEEVATLEYADSFLISPDGTRLASAWKNGTTIRLWNLETGGAVATLEAHSENTFHKMAFSPDGTLLASVLENDTIRLWDAKTGGTVATLEGLRKWDVAFSPDGQRLVSSDPIVWDVETGTALARCPPRSAHNSSLAFSPAGPRLASASVGGGIVLWNTETGEAIATLEGHTELVGSLAFSPNGTLLASGSDDEPIRLWNVETREAVATFEGPTGPVRSMAFSPDGTLLAFLSGSREEDQTLGWWNAETGEVVATEEERASFVAFSPDGALLKAYDEDAKIDVRNAETGESVATLEGRTLAFSPDGARLASGFEDGTIRVWDVETGEVVATAPWDTLSNMALSPGGTRLALGSRGGAIELWDVETGPSASILDESHGGPSRRGPIAFSPDGTHLAYPGYNPGDVRVWNTASGKSIAALRTGEKQEPLSMAFSSDGARLAVVSSDQPISWWNIETGEAVANLEGRSSGAEGLALSPDGTRLAELDGDIIRLSDVEIGEAVAVLEGHRRRVLDLALSPDGRHLAYRSSDGSIRLWNVEMGESVATLGGRDRAVLGFAFSPDGNLLAYGSEDHMIRLRNVEAGKHVATLAGHTDGVVTLAFSPDGALLASGSSAGSIRMWDVETGESTATWAGHPDEVQGLAFSPDGKLLASASEQIRLWHTLDIEAFTSPATRADALVSIYRVSLEWMGYRRDGMGFKPAPGSLSLIPIGGYRFPRPRSAPRILDRPRPPGKDVLEWLLEGAAELPDP